MAEHALLPDPTSLHLVHIETERNVITMVVRTTASEAKCSLCENTSTKVHSRYTRLLADLPWMGCAVRLKLHLRRFFCENPDCQRQIFAERLPSMVAPYARRTLRLHELLTLIGFAVGGEAGEIRWWRHEAFHQPRYPAPADPHGAGSLSCHPSRAGSGRFCVSPPPNLWHDPHRS